MAAVKIAPFDGLAPSLSEAEAGPLLEVGFDRVAAVRERLGREPLPMVNCHEWLNTSTLRDVLAETASHGLYWLESPFKEEPRWFHEIRRTPSRRAARRLRPGLSD